MLWLLPQYTYKQRAKSSSIRMTITSAGDLKTEQNFHLSSPSQMYTWRTMLTYAFLCSYETDWWGLRYPNTPYHHTWYFFPPHRQTVEVIVSVLQSFLYIVSEYWMMESRIPATSGATYCRRSISYTVIE